MINERNGKFIQVYSGNLFWPLDPREEDIRIEDISHALSNQCRFSGHTEKHYSVAQHCVYVSLFVELEFALAGLLHDASEAYLVDVPRPIKPELPQYSEIEANIMKIIAKRFGFQYPLPQNVIDIDNAMLWIEKQQVMKPDIDWWQDKTVEIPKEIRNLKIQTILPEDADRMFQQQFHNSFLMRHLPI